MKFRSSSHLIVVPVLLSSLLLFSLASCSLLGEENQDRRENRWVAVTAVFDETNESGAPIQRIVLVNFDAPTQYRVLTPDTITAAVRPRVSPGGRWVIFEHHITGLGSRPWITLLDGDVGSVQPLYAGSAGGDRGAPLLGTIGGFVWGPDGKGFYAAAPGPAGLGSFLYHYDLESQLIEPVRERQVGPTVVPYGLKGRDSLLVLSTDEAATGDTVPGFYFMDAESGEYLEHVENEHLRFVSREGSGWLRTPINAAYNDEKRLIVFELHEDSPNDSPPSGQSFTIKIVITNLDGSFVRTCTSGEEYLDRHPRWGPDGTVLFDRVLPRSAGGWRDFRVVALDFESCEVREFVDPTIINGAAGLRLPDY